MVMTKLPNVFEKYICYIIDKNSEIMFYYTFSILHSYIFVYMYDIQMCTCKQLNVVEVPPSISPELKTMKKAVAV